MRRGTVKLFHRLPAVLSALEDAPLALWQAYRTLMESYLTHA